MERPSAEHSFGEGKPVSICNAEITLLIPFYLPQYKTFKHVFTSPSSVEREAKATRSGNARIHGMTRVTRASIAYVATQVRFF